MYTELHCHGYYSLMDGYNSPLEIATIAKECGHRACSITDHGTLAAHREFQQACRQVGIKPILGQEAYISPTDRFDRRPIKKREDNVSIFNHLIVLAKTQQGLANLQAMNELAWTEGFYNKPRIDKELLTQYKDGLIVLSGCMNGLVSKAIERENPAEAKKWMQYFTDTFGEDFYVEIQPHNPPSLNAALTKLALEFGVRGVVTNDCHFTKPEERAAEEVMLILSTGPKESGKFYKDVQHLEFFDMLDALYPDRNISFAELDLFLKTESQVYDELIASGQADAAKLIEATEEITDKVQDYEFYEKLDLLPTIKIDLPDDTELYNQVKQGLIQKTLWFDEYEDRIKEELKVIADLKFSRYFLIVADIIRHAKSEGILMSPGRGSSAGSLVCYALDITQVDPIEHKLLFFRFLDPDRPDWPDIDMDFEDKRRHEIIDYVRTTYGHVANISTYEYFKDKKVLKQVARALRVPYGEVSVMAKTFDRFEEYEDQSTNLDTAIGKFHSKYPLVLHFAQKLRGKVTGAGLHPAGVVLSNKPIEQFVPVESRKDKATEERLPALVADLEGAESIGLIKLDFLGLKTLTIVSEALEMAGLGPADLPNSFNDPKVLNEYIKGHTVGIFQAEQSAYTKLLREMDEVDFTFKDLVASNALVRPGAMNTVGREYLVRRSGKEKVEYDHPSLKEITGETFGVLIYQEQLMQTAVALGGFTMREANKLRRIIGKKKDPIEFKPFEDKWMQGAGKLIGKQRAAKLWGDFQAHAGYSFNKSHAVAYSMLSYWTMWLKYYYPLEFITAALGAEKTASSNAKWSKLLLESKRLGIEILLPHVNLSDTKPKIHDQKVLLGLANVKFISEKTAAPLLKARPFNKYSELLDLSTTKNSGVSTRTLSALNALNAASFVDNPAKTVKHNLYEYIGIPSFTSTSFKHPERITSLENFDEQGAFVMQALVQKIKRGPGWARCDLLDETGTQGIFHKEQTQLAEGQYHTFLVASNSIIDWLTDDPTTVFARWLEADRLPGTLLLALSSRMTKAGKEMATAVWSDTSFQLTGTLIFPGTYAKLKQSLQPGRLIQPFIGETDDGSLMLKGID